KAFSAKATNDTKSQAQSAIDKAAKKGVIHKNKAARLQKRAAAQAKAAGVKPGKAAAKKAAPAKKPTAKKPVTKKAPAKKK
ncbi:MAG TPA: 30S ribosomal protein S20, partial [Candidatus Saccharimonadales bacterium]|nr:30S ribosomal protein S20 [Candidatus Saccharimonadales bacterium]